MTRAPRILALLSVLAGCGAASPNPCAGGAGLDPDECLLPWPSSAFLVADASTRTGWRLNLPASLMPTNSNGVQIDPAPWNRWDGFSPMTTLLADFASPIDARPLATWHNPGPSLAADSPTVIVDVDTGERIAHFAELESSPEVAPGHSTLYVRPAARLAEGHHYAVGIRSLRNLDGTAVAPTAPFRELRDRAPSSLEARRASMEHDVFAPLAQAGVERSTLVLAWDFRTASGATAWGDLVEMRDAAVAAAGPGGLGCSITNVVEDPTDPLIFRQLEGQFTVPNFLTTAADGSVRLARDASGRPIAQGTQQASFIAIIPRSAVARANAGDGPAPLWIYGHGLFSARDEITRDFGRATAAQGGAIAAATDYTGLTASDLQNTVNAVIDLSKFPSIMDQLRQGLINTVLLPRTFAGACASEPALSTGGPPLIDGADWSYFGNSMGGTLGSAVAGLSPDLKRFALGVGGIDFPVMMPRTTLWPHLEAFFRIGYPTRLDRDLLLVMSANQWDLAEASAFAPHVLHDPLPGSHAARVLFQVGLYDADTTNVASEIAGRTLGLTELSPTVHAVWGLAQAPPAPDSAYVVYDMGAAPPPEGTLPFAENGVHEGVRRDPRAQAQIAAFLHSGGAIFDTCGGACTPLTP
jgi:hypothetical protein